jgi:hypothetical protein
MHGYTVEFRKKKRRRCLEYLDFEGSKIFKQILNKRNETVWTGFVRLFVESLRKLL